RSSCRDREIRSRSYDSSGCRGRYPKSDLPGRSETPAVPLYKRWIQSRAPRTQTERSTDTRNRAARAGGKNDSAGSTRAPCNSTGTTSEAVRGIRVEVSAEALLGSEHRWGNLHVPRYPINAGKDACAARPVAPQPPARVRRRSQTHSSTRARARSETQVRAR